MEKEFDFADKTLEQLKTALDLAEKAEFYMSMSDNYCYSTGRIYPLQKKVKALQSAIEEKLEQAGLLDVDEDAKE